MTPQPIDVDESSSRHTQSARILSSSRTASVDDIEAPHHTLVDADESDDDTGSHGLNYPHISKATQQIRDSDYAGDNDDENDDESSSSISGSRAVDLKTSLMSAAPLDDDEYETRASVVGAGGFTDRRGSRLRRKASSSIFARVWEIGREALPTLIVSLLSLMFSGELLVHLARWPVFLKVDKLFILIPILLNMKGNLEMNLSLRMSTSANIGELDVRRTRETLIKGNMALLQVQALIVSLFAGILAFVLGVLTPDTQTELTLPPSKGSAQDFRSSENAIVNGVVKSVFSALTLRQRCRAVTDVPGLQARRIIHHHPKPSVDPALRLRNGYFEFVLVIATGMLSASLSSAILGSFMCALVVIARRAGANPDNIASPLAASLGDLTTLTLLGLLASTLVHFEGTLLATVILAGLVAACIACFIATYRNAYVRELLTSGWMPLLVAMFVSSGAGLVLDNFVQKYEGFGLLAPVISGLPGACAAIFASRISTALHSGKGVEMLRTASKSYHAPGLRGFFGSLGSVLRIPPIEGWLVPLSLLTMGLSIKIFFVLLIRLSGQMTFGLIFATCFIAASAVANAFALYLAHVICLVLWSRDYDPDIYCLPFVSSMVDVVGQSLLVLTFSIATNLGEHVTAAVNAGAGHGGV